VRSYRFLAVLIFLFSSAFIISAEPLIERRSWEFLLVAEKGAEAHFLGAGREQPSPALDKRPAIRTSSEFKLALISVLRIYQLFISSQDQPSCAFTPSCSQYAKEAVAKHGPVLGVIMAAARLQRCHGMGAGYYPIHPVTGKFYDPVD
jgi:uncharacterized protein